MGSKSKKKGESKGLTDLDGIAKEHNKSTRASDEDGGSFLLKLFTCGCAGRRRKPKTAPINELRNAHVQYQEAESTAAQQKSNPVQNPQHQTRGSSGTQKRVSGGGAHTSSKM